MCVHMYVYVCVCVCVYVHMCVCVCICARGREEHNIQCSQRFTPVTMVTSPSTFFPESKGQLSHNIIIYYACEWYSGKNLYLQGKNYRYYLL